MGRRAGFSLLEALVALAVTSLVLVLLATVATRATRQGFRLSGRALAASDGVVGATTVRELLRGVRLPSHEAPWAGAFAGGPEAISAAVLIGRATPCGGPGPSAVVRLWLATAQGRTRLLCAAAEAPQRAVPLMDLGSGPAGFLYAGPDGRWRDRLSVAPPPPQAATSTAAAPPIRLWIRLWSGGGGLVEAVARPPPRAGGVSG